MGGSRSFSSSPQAPRWTPEQPGPGNGPGRHEEGHKPRLSAWQEGIVLVVMAVLVAVVVKALFVQAFYIPSESMEPGLQGGPSVATDDRVLVEKPSYWLAGTPQRGDVVVFSDPGSWLGVDESAGPSNLIGKGIRVNCVAPGPVWTPLNPSEKEAKDVAKFGADTPMKRPAQPEEIAPAYVFLASPQMSSYITGEILPIVGGY